MNMRHTIIVVLLCTSFASWYNRVFSKDIGKTFFSQRPQGFNSAIKIAGTMYLEQIFPCERNYDRFSVALEFLEAVNTKSISEFLFFNGGTRMRFGNADGENVDIFSRNFFLNDDFQGIAEIEPSLQNFIVHLDLSYNLDCLKKGLYFSSHVPIVWTQWNLDLDETAPTAAKMGTFIPKQTFGNSFDKPSPVKTIVQAWKGDTINTNSNPNNKDEDFFPDLKQPMHFAVIDGQQTRANLGDVEFTLGYNVLTQLDAHFDIQARLVIPTGTRPNGHFFFEPVVGNGHHFMLGFGITAHDDLECKQDRLFSYFIDAGIYHVFKAKQKRTFDLINNGIGSRYLLFKRFDAAGVFANEILFGPNVTTLDCHVSSDFMTDISVVGQYTWQCLTLSLGYNLWGRSKEKITLLSSIPKNTFGIQGKTTSADNNTASKTLVSGKNATLIDPEQVFISTNDIDINSATHPLSVSHKLFAHMGYGWLSHPFTPFIGVGLEGEISALNNSAASQIGLWAKGGITF